MFLGQFEHSLDEKNRLTLPARLRSDLEGGMVITRGIDPCLLVFTLDKWKELAAKIDELPLTQKNSRLFSRLMFSKAVNVVPDRQGRIRIPDYLLAYAGINSDVVIVGLNSKIEIWSKERWAEQEAYVEKDIERVAELFASLGI